jgi:hypothetical protein
MAKIEGADALMKNLEDIAGKMKSGSVKVGFMEGATYPGGTSVAAVAFWNEFGHRGKFPAPPRPFFRNMINEESPTWPKKVAALLKAKKFDTRNILELMGEDIKGALQQSITKLTIPELSQTTLMLRHLFGNNPQNIRARDVIAAQQLVAEGEKGATGTQAKPLIWTGHMLNSITYEVTE